MSRASALEGCVALITGAGGDIGREASLVFAERGAFVMAADIDGERAQDTAGRVLAQGGRASAAQLDVRDGEAVAHLVKSVAAREGSLDCAFNNAGIAGSLHSLVEYPDDEFRRVMETNVTGVWNCMRAEIPAMLAGRGGAIVNASSGLGVVASPNMSAYVASKHAVMGLTQSAALEYSAQGVRVNALLPGVIDTAMPARLTEGRPETRAAMLAAHPAGRLGTPREVALVAAWLCSPAASFVTGHGTAVDGGYLAQ